AHLSSWRSQTDVLISPTSVFLAGFHSVEDNAYCFAIWSSEPLQSFDSPTNTLLPNQPLTRNKKLMSSRSQNNYSSGFYKLLFDNDNILCLVFDDLEVTSVYWPNPWKNSWDALRKSFTNNRTAMFNSSGHFKSNDDFQFRAADFGTGIQRRLTMDHDGNI
ncbi:hypothetical protein HYC85_008409, partial [Camellia sinensis]